MLSPAGTSTDHGNSESPSCPSCDCCPVGCRGDKGEGGVDEDKGDGGVVGGESKDPAAVGGLATWMCLLVENKSLEADSGGEKAGEKGEGGVVEDAEECGESADRAAAGRVVLTGDNDDGGVVEDEDIDRRSGEFMNKEGDDITGLTRTSTGPVGRCDCCPGSEGGEGGCKH